MDGIGSDKIGLKVTARTETGAMYGLYKIISDLGVRYFHPEETFYPSNPEATIPWNYRGEVDIPSFEMRGFHEHTQHPIVMSDFLLRHDKPEFKIYLNKYLKWLVRNRQNTLTFHLLKTVDIENWIPYIKAFIEEAHNYSISIGTVIGRSDFSLSGNGRNLPISSRTSCEKKVRISYLL